MNVSLILSIIFFSITSFASSELGNPKLQIKFEGPNHYEISNLTEAGKNALSELLLNNPIIKTTVSTVSQFIKQEETNSLVSGIKNVLQANDVQFYLTIRNNPTPSEWINFQGELSWEAIGMKNTCPNLKGYGKITREYNIYVDYNTDNNFVEDFRNDRVLAELYQQVIGLDQNNILCREATELVQGLD